MKKLDKFLIFVLLSVLVLPVVWFFETFDPTSLTARGTFMANPGPKGTILFLKAIDGRSVPYITVFGTHIGLRIQMDTIPLNKIDLGITGSTAWSPDGGSFAFNLIEVVDDRHAYGKLCIAQLEGVGANVECKDIPNDVADQAYDLSLGTNDLAFTIWNDEANPTCILQVGEWNLNGDWLGLGTGSKNDTRSTISPDGTMVTSEIADHGCIDTDIIVWKIRGARIATIEHMTEATWSTNGKLYFHRPNNFIDPPINAIGVYDIANDITTITDIEYGEIQEMAVSSNGKVVFVTSKGTVVTGLSVLYPDGSVLEVVSTNGETSVHWPKWINDHQLIVTFWDKSIFKNPRNVIYDIQ